MVTAVIDDSTPVMIGVGLIEQKCEQADQAAEPCQLMLQALLAAADDAQACGGGEVVLSQVDRIYCPQGLWSYRDPAGWLAKQVGAEHATSVLAEFGILQQSLIGQACEQIRDGHIEVAVVVGGEAKYRQLMAGFQGVELSETVIDQTPDVTLSPEKELWIEAESQAGLSMPVGYYAILENARRARLGRTPEQQRDIIANIYQEFSDVAIDNPHAWKRVHVDAASIRDSSDKNPMLAYPYTKLHNASWNVDQASALLFCSAAKARALGIAERHWVFPLASTESNEQLCVSQRPHLDRSVATELVVQEALKIVGVEAQEIEYLDLYSCFPIAVQLFADALFGAGQRPQRPLSFTGAMPFAGGPLNNYVLQTTAQLAKKLRAEPGAMGLVSSVSGLMTKPAVGIWRTMNSAHASELAQFDYRDVREQVQQAERPVVVLDDYQGPATIVGFTVLYEGGHASRAVVVADTPAAQRCIAYSDSAELMTLMQQVEAVGWSITVEGDQFRRAD